MTTEEVPWESVWALYLENRKTFSATFASLAAHGTPVPAHLQGDLVHEFLLDRVQHALTTFRPEKGALAGWLFVVFRRFVLGALKQRGAQARRTETLDLVAEPETPLISPEITADGAMVRAALASLPPDERAAIEILLEPNGSVRKVAKLLGLSRWTANRRVERGLERLRLRLGPRTSEAAELSVDRIQLIRKALEDGHE